MEKIIVLLCLGLLGCATVATETNAIEKSAALNEMEMDGIISIFSQAIENNPNYGGAYYNRAIAHFYYQNDYEKCWQDVHMAESLGYKFSANFLSALKEASRREK